MLLRNRWRIFPQIRGNVLSFKVKQSFGSLEHSRAFETGQIETNKLK